MTCETLTTTSSSIGWSEHHLHNHHGVGSSTTSAGECPTTVAATREGAVDPSPVGVCVAACHDADAVAFRQSVVSGIESGAFKLVPVSEGLGGTYFVVGPRNRHVALFKPASQEVGTKGNPKGNTEAEKMGFPPGHGYRREIAAYRLDHSHFARVPLTVEVELLGDVGSLQAFVHCDGDGAYGPGKYKTDDVHRIGILDVRLLNCDRHEGNILNIVDKDAGDAKERLSLIPIDHGYVLPQDGFQDLEFDWLYYPQAKQPFSREALDYIMALNADADANLLLSMGFSDEVADNVKGATIALKLAASRGYTLREIGEFCRRTHITQPSGLESALAASRVDMDLGGHVDWDAFRAHIDAALVAKA